MPEFRHLSLSIDDYPWIVFRTDFDCSIMIEVIRWCVYYGLHFFFPWLLAKRFAGDRVGKVYLILFSTMLVDLDHLLARPLFDPQRCSIGFHPLHSYYAMGVYCLMLGYKPTRVIALGLCLHMLTDTIDCFWMGFY